MEHLEPWARWAGFLGGWLLVAGPIHQATIELREEAAASEHFERVRQRMDGQHPPNPSAWWWLLPPVYLVLRHRRSDRARAAFVQTLTPDELRTLMSYIQKATGWLIVGLGAFFIAVKETFELVESRHWPPSVFAALVVVALGSSVGNAVVRQRRTDAVLAGLAGPTEEVQG